MPLNNYVHDSAKKFVAMINSKQYNRDQKNLHLRKKIDKYKKQIKKEEKIILEKMINYIYKEVLHFDDNHLSVEAEFLKDNRIGFVLRIKKANNDVSLSETVVVYSDHNNWEIIQDDGETVLTSKTDIANFAYIELLNCISSSLRIKKAIGYKHKDIHNLFIYYAEMRYYKSYLIKNLYFY